MGASHSTRADHKGIIENSILKNYNTLYTRLSLGPLTPQPPRKSQILRLNGDTLGVDGGEIGVFKERDKIGLCGFLERHDGRRLES